jgi:predicted SAM-dependent methyltransferase
MNQLHLGCGKRYLPGFIHVDIADYQHLDYQHDISRLPMFEDNSVDLIYCCHALEYFDRIGAMGALKEWNRILRPDGILRLAVPDFEALIEVYRQYGDLKKIIGPLYGLIEVDSANGKSVLHHRTVYDFQSIRELLEETGYHSIERYDWRNTIHKDYDDFSQAYIPHMDKEGGLLISLNVEARKIGLYEK